MKNTTALKLVLDELERTRQEHAALSSTHEGYAVLLEEVDELWDEVKAGNGTSHRGTSEAVQVAASALRYLEDLCADSAATEHETKVSQYVSSFGRGSAGGYSG